MAIEKYFIGIFFVPQALEYRINLEIYTPYAGAAGMLIHINRKFTI
jgi:hypothetical protein